MCGWVGEWLGGWVAGCVGGWVDMSQTLLCMCYISVDCSCLQGMADLTRKKKNEVKQALQKRVEKW